MYANGRLIYYMETANSDYWDQYWDSLITPSFYDTYRHGELDDYSESFVKYLNDKEARILEAGCGTARYIVALNARGYKHVEGIEWGERTVQKVLDLFPDLFIRVGDVMNVAVSDNYYDAYLSLGVVEHRLEGPEPFLREAFRILKPGGIGLIGIPHVNVLRKFKGLLGFYRLNNKQETTFYQYAFPKSEFAQILEKIGFNIIDTKGIDGYFGLREELPFLFRILDRLPGHYRIKRYLMNAQWPKTMGHIVLFVCRKPLN